MRIIFVFLTLCLCNMQVAAKNTVSLNEAVNQAKTEGRVLSAKTVNGKHEIKVLTSSGTVKTISKSANNGQSIPKTSRPDFYNKGGRSMRDRKQNQTIPDRFGTQKKVIKVDKRKVDMKSKSRQMKSSKNNKNKDK